MDKTMTSRYQGEQAIIRKTIKIIKKRFGVCTGTEFSCYTCRIMMVKNMLQDLIDDYKSINDHLEERKVTKTTKNKKFKALIHGKLK